MDPVIPFNYTLEHLFDDGDKIVHIERVRSFIEFLDLYNLYELFGTGMERYGSDRAFDNLNYLFELGKDGFNPGGDLSKVSKLAFEILPEDLDPFFSSLNTQELVVIVEFCIINRIPPWYQYILSYYLKPSLIPKVMWDNGNYDYPEYLESMNNTIVLFKDLDFITNNKILMNNAYNNLIMESSKMIQGWWPHHQEERGYVPNVNDIGDIPDIEILLNRSFDNYNKQDIMTLILRKVRGEESRSISKLDKLIEFYFGKSLSQGTDRSDDFKRLQEQIQTNRLHRLMFDTENTRQSINLLSLEENFEGMLTYLKEQSVWDYEPFETRVKFYFEFADPVMDQARDEFETQHKNNVQTDVVDQFYHYLYHKIEDLIYEYVPEEYQNEALQRWHQSDKNLPQIILDSFINEDVKLQRKIKGDELDYSFVSVAKNFDYIYGEYELLDKLKS